MRRRLASPLAVALLQLGPVPVGAGAPVVPAPFSQCLFYDDFSDLAPGALPSPSRWTLDLGTSYPGGPPQWGNKEAQTYTAGMANILITAQGTLKITPRRAADGSWTSARIQSTPAWDFACRPGQMLRVEATLRLGDDPESAQEGIWPAFWALGADIRGRYASWPAGGEIDVMETVNGKTTLWQTAHCGVLPGGPCNEPTGISSTTAGLTRGAWHTVAWEVDRRRALQDQEDHMSWFVDGVRHWTLAQSDVRDAAAWEALAGNAKMLLLNVAVGGVFPDAIAGFKTPTAATVGGEGASMEVDHVAVYV